MIVTFSARDGLKEAFVKTFDGKHACKLCKFVSEGKKGESKNSTPQSSQKLDPMIITSIETRIERNLYEVPKSTPFVLLARNRRPLTPPPDVA